MIFEHFPGAGTQQFKMLYLISPMTYLVEHLELLCARSWKMFENDGVDHINCDLP